MRTDLRRKSRRKLAAALLSCGMLFQSATCSSTIQDLSQAWVTTVVDVWIQDFFANQLNVTSSSFF